MRILSLVVVLFISPVLHAEVGCDFFLTANLKEVNELKFVELHGKLTALVNRIRANEKKSPLKVEILDYEHIAVVTEESTVKITMGLLLFAENDTDLARILQYEMSHPNSDQPPLQKYKELLSGTLELNPALEYINPAPMPSASPVMSVAREITTSQAYLNYITEKFDSTMRIDLSDVRANIAPLYTGDTPPPAYVGDIYAVIRNYLEKFQKVVPYDSTPAQIARRFEIRMQFLIRKQMNRFVEEILHARAKLDKPITRDEKLILNQMLGRFWLLYPQNNTPMMRRGSSPWLLSWTLELGKSHQELASLQAQLTEAGTERRRDVLQQDILQLVEKQAVLREKIKKVREFYQLSTHQNRMLAYIEARPDAVGAALTHWDHDIHQALRGGAGFHFTRARQLTRHIESQMNAEGRLLAEVRAKPEDAYSILLSLKDQPLEVRIEAHKKAQALLIELGAYESLRSILGTGTGYDIFYLSWFKKDPDEARASLIQGIRALKADKTFNPNETDIVRGESFFSSFVTYARFLERHIYNIPEGTVVTEGGILTSEVREALLELAVVRAKELLEEQRKEQQAVLNDRTLKDRDQKLYRFVAYPKILKEFHKTVFTYLASENFVPYAAVSVSTVAVNVLADLLRSVRRRDSVPMARALLSLTIREGTIGADPRSVQELAENLNQIPFMRGQDFIPIGNFINFAKDLPRAEMLGLALKLQDYITNQYLEPTPQGMADARFFDLKYQIALAYINQAQPNFIQAGRVMKNWFTDDNKREEHGKISKPLQLNILLKQFEYYWNKHSQSATQLRVQQTLGEFMPEAERLLSDYGAKEGLIATAEKLLTNGDRRMFYQEIINYLQSNPRAYSTLREEMITGLQMKMRLGL